jgi:PAS domain S-box-containing protein
MDQPIENLQADVLSRIPVAVYTTDDRGLLTFFNRKAEMLWGRKPRLRDPSEVPFSGAWQLYGSDGTPLARDNSPVAVALGSRREPEPAELCIGRPDGTKVTVAVHIRLLSSDDGSSGGALVVLHEITRYKKMEETAPRLAAIVESSSDAIIGKDLTGVISSWNRGATEIFGYPEKEALGRNIRFIIPGDRQQEEDMILERIRRGEKLESFETVRLTKDHKEIPVSVTVSPIRNATGQIVGASKIARDISLMLEAREKVRTYTEELKHVNTAKDNIIAITSHELKTPLTVLKATLQILQSGDLPTDEQQELIEKALSQEKRLEIIIANLADISRMEVGKLSFRFTDFCAKELLDECVDNILMGDPSRTVIRRYRLGDVTVRADKVRIGQVMNNLLSNALKYSPRESPVVVEGRSMENDLLVTVADSGRGIAEEHLRKVFDIFFRSRQAAEVPGMGVGLYLS